MTAHMIQILGTLKLAATDALPLGLPAAMSARLSAFQSIRL
jgi:hypothetical protein